MNLGVQKAERLAMARQADAPNITGEIGGHQARPLGPPAQTAERIKPAVHRRRAVPRRDHGLAIGDQIELGQPFEHGDVPLDRLMPTEEMPQIVPVAAHGRSGEVFPLEAIDEAGQPVRVVRSWERVTCTQCDPRR